MNNSIQELRLRIIDLASQKTFKHYKWYVKWHLEIVEKISIELCNKFYKNADLDLVLALVWIHDYTKIINSINPYDKNEILNIKIFLNNLGFKSEFIDKLIDLLLIFESKMTYDLHNAPIEVQIVSSADACSHMIGPFYFIYWYENPNIPIEDILKGNLNKLDKDWNRKITIPEVKEKFLQNYDFLRFFSGELPEKFFD